MRKLAIVLALLPALPAPFAAAADAVHAGNGCPAGSAAVVLSPDSRQLIGRFTQLRASAGAVSGRRIDRASCAIAVPLKIPSNWSVALGQADVRGRAAVPGGALVRASVEAFYAGQIGKKTVAELRGQGAYRIRAGAVPRVWSECGVDVIARVNLAVDAQAGAAGEASADVSSLAMPIAWRKCSRPLPPRTP